MDVLVIGGGPGGASAAALLAKSGFAVTVVEKERFPRHHVGESLQPSSLKLLDHHFALGTALEGCEFARKYGAVYIWGEKRDPWTVLFDDRLEACHPNLSEAELLNGGFEYAWQVDRAKFDHILLKNAVQHGATVLEGWQAEIGTWNNETIQTVALRGPEGERKSVSPKWVIDASGQRCWAGRQLGAVHSLPDLQSTATYGYFWGSGGVEGPLGRHVQYVVTYPEGWLWFIPTSSDWTSIGLVTKQKSVPNEAEFLEIVRETLGEAMVGTLKSRHGSLLHHARDWSYVNRRFTGNNWLCVGDAAAFVDPILSGGVDFAIRSGLNGALAVIAGAQKDNTAIERYRVQLDKELKSYLRMARYWYGNNRSVDGFFWEAHRQIPPGSASTPLRAFVYLTSGKYAADSHFKVFNELQERNLFERLGVNRGALQKHLKDSH